METPTVKDQRRSKKGRLFLSVKRKKKSVDNLRKWPLKKRVIAEDNIVSTMQIQPPDSDSENAIEDMATEVVHDPALDSAISLINGRFIVDGQHFVKEIRSLENHRNTCLKSRQGYFRLISTSTKALIWRLDFQCPYCSISKSIFSEPNPEMPEESECPKSNEFSALKIVDGAVWGFMSIGGGYSNMEEVFSTLGIKSIDKETFRKYEEKLGLAWKDVLLELMLQSGREEKSLAIEAGDVTSSGTPFITVIVDGGWSQRSHGHRYTALSGVVCVIGHRTKKLLHLDVRNKYCSMCMYLEKLGKSTKHENCYKNWDSSSGAMEADMVVQAFRSSKQLHDLEYHYLVGDGDSSVMKKVRELVPYGRHVKKIECANHAVKCYTKALFKIPEVRPNLKGVLTKVKILRLKKAARGAITHNATERNSVESLVYDLKNGPKHVFGCHASCRDYFCQAADRQAKTFNEEENVCLENIEVALRPLIRKSGQLITNDTSNHAENFMSVVAKFSGGKQVHRCKRGSYQHRAYGAGLDFQLGPMWRYSAWKALTGRSPHRAVKFTCQRRLKRLQAVRRCLVNQGKRKQKNVAKKNEGNDYGEMCQKLDMDLEEFEKEVDALMKKLEVTPASRDKLEKDTQGQSEKERWWEERRNRLTSSNFGVICKRRRTSKWAPIVKRLLYESKFSNEATQYGQMHEKEAIRQYEEITGRQVSPSGLFVDLKQCFFAASPDGITDDGGIIEVKCPKSAENFTLEEAAKKIKYFCLDQNLQLKKCHNYYYQVQGQLHVTGAPFCDFVVWTKKDCRITKILRDDEFWSEKMEPKLVFFYNQVLLPEIIDPRLCRSMDLREPEFPSK